jgi:hypothetical protein
MQMQSEAVQMRQRRRRLLDHSRRTTSSRRCYSVCRRRPYAGAGACARPGVPSSPSRPSSPHGDPAAAPARSSSPCSDPHQSSSCACWTTSATSTGCSTSSGPSAGADAAQPYLRRDRMQLGAMIIDSGSGRDFTVVGTNDPPRP